MHVLSLVAVGIFVICGTPLDAAVTSLFDGKTLTGWEGDTKVWRVQDGAIVGGSMQGNPQNEFLTSTKRYRNFALRLQYRLVGTDGFVNGGIQIRSERIKNPPNEMIGYQADIGAGFSGSLYDESRANKFLAQAKKDLVEKAEKKGEWNQYEIRAEGKRVQVFINDVQTIDYMENRPDIAPSGVIGLQIHGGCKAEISYRAIQLVELP